MEIIGEAAKKIPLSLTKNYSDLNCSKMAKLRDVIIHHYHGLDEKVIWDICKFDIKDLNKKILNVISFEINRIAEPALMKLAKQKIKEINSNTKFIKRRT